MGKEKFADVKSVCSRYKLTDGEKRHLVKTKQQFQVLCRERNKNHMFNYELQKRRLDFLR